MCCLFTALCCGIKTHRNFRSPTTPIGFQTAHTHLGIRVLLRLYLRGLEIPWLRTDGARFLQLFLLAGQTYLQPPDLIDVVVRHKVARSALYPEVSLPATTEQWIRPSNAFAFPTNVAIDG